MKFLNPTLLALLGAGFCCGEGQEECSEPNRKLEQYDGGNQGVGEDNQWDGRKNRWIGNRNAIKGDKNNLVGDNNQVRGRSNWVSGQSNDINGKRNTVKGRGNVIHGRGNVVSNTFGEDLDFDIESRFPAWMRSTSKDKKKKDKKKKAVQPRYIEANEGTEEERPWARRNWPFGEGTQNLIQTTMKLSSHAAESPTGNDQNEPRTDGRLVRRVRTEALPSENPSESEFNSRSNGNSVTTNTNDECLRTLLMWSIKMKSQSISEKNRAAYLKSLNYLKLQPAVVPVEQLKPIVYSNEEYLLTLNEKKKVEFKKIDFAEAPTSVQRVDARPPRQPQQHRPNIKASQEQELSELLRLFDEGTVNEPYQQYQSSPARSLYFQQDRHALVEASSHAEYPPKQKRKPDFRQPTNRQPSLPNKKIGKCNYRSGDVEQWSSDSSIPDSRLYYLLRNRFGLKQFRNNQKAIVKCSISGNDVFVCMPTGGGKSLTFQLPLLYQKGLTVCIMPLVSLIFDQEYLSKKLKLNAYAATGSTTLEEFHQFYSQLRELEGMDEGVILLTTPEKITASHRMLDELEQVYNRNLLVRIVIDEAHCVSTWGRDFREDYANLGFLKRKFPKTPVLALTATATEQVKNDVIGKLGMDQCYFFQSSFNRPNLFYSVKEKSKRVKDMVVSICRKYEGKSGIIYCLSKKECEKMAQALNKERIRSAFYHADLKNQKKKEIQESWMNNRILVIVATIAFGMGINKPDVRFVIHQTISKSLQNYYQESGRAGRDGEPAECILFYRRSDKLMFMNFNLNNEFSTVESKDFNTKSLLAMIRYGDEKFQCRRVMQMRYLGQSFTKEQCSKTCDNCQLNRQYRQTECLEGVREMIELLTQTSQVRENLTLTQLTVLLSGKTNKQLAQKRQFMERKGVHLSRYSYFTGWKQPQLEHLAMSLIHDGVLRQQAYVVNKFTQSMIKVDSLAYREFLRDRSSYTIKTEVSKKAVIERQVIEEQDEEEADDINSNAETSEALMFEQYSRSKEKPNQQNSVDEELFQMLEEERNNRMLLKYLAEEEPTAKEHVPADEDDLENLLQFLENA